MIYTKYVNVKNNFNEYIEIEFIIVIDQKEAKILISFLDNEDFLFWLDTVVSDNKKDLEKKFKDKINSYINNKESLKYILDIIEFKNYDLSNYNNILNLINRSFIF